MSDKFYGKDENGIISTFMVKDASVSLDEDDLHVPKETVDIAHELIDQYLNDQLLLSGIQVTSIKAEPDLLPSTLSNLLSVAERLIKPILISDDDTIRLPFALYLHDAEDLVKHLESIGFTASLFTINCTRPRPQYRPHRIVTKTSSDDKLKVPVPSLESLSVFDDSITIHSSTAPNLFSFRLLNVDYLKNRGFGFVRLGRPVFFNGLDLSDGSMKVSELNELLKTKFNLKIMGVAKTSEPLTSGEPEKNWDLLIESINPNPGSADPENSDISESKFDNFIHWLHAYNSKLDSHLQSHQSIFAKSADKFNSLQKDITNLKKGLA